MKKDSYELLNDGFLNLYEEWIFIRCFEYTALELYELFWYKLMPWIDRKNGKVFLELWFPKSKKTEIFSFLENRNYFYRFISKSDWLSETIWSYHLNRDCDKLLKIKKELINFW